MPSVLGPGSFKQNVSYDLGSISWFERTGEFDIVITSQISCLADIQFLVFSTVAYLDSLQHQLTKLLRSCHEHRDPS